MQYCFKGFNCLETLNARVYIAHGEQQQTKLCGCYDLQRAQWLARKKACVNISQDIECASEFSLFVCCFLLLMDQTMFTLIVGDICERFYDIYTGCSFSHAL